MKFAVVTAVLATQLAQAAEIDTVFTLLKASGLTSKLDCTVPCILEAADSLPYDGKGPAHVICSNIDNIAEKARPCSEKCEAKRANAFVVELTRYVCKQGKFSSKHKGQKAEEVKDEESEDTSEEEEDGEEADEKDEL